MEVCDDIDPHRYASINYRAAVQAGAVGPGCDAGQLHCKPLKDGRDVLRTSPWWRSKKFGLHRFGAGTLTP